MFLTFAAVSLRSLMVSAKPISVASTSLATILCETVLIKLFESLSQQNSIDCLTEDFWLKKKFSSKLA